MSVGPYSPKGPENVKITTLCQCTVCALVKSQMVGVKNKIMSLHLYVKHLTITLMFFSCRLLEKASGTYHPTYEGSCPERCRVQGLDRGTEDGQGKY